MPDDDPNAIPYPPEHGAEYRHLLSQFADVVQEIVRFGWLTVHDATQGPSGGHAKIVGLAWYRHLLEHIDGVSVLIRQGWALLRIGILLARYGRVVTIESTTSDTIEDHTMCDGYLADLTINCAATLAMPGQPYVPRATASSPYCDTTSAYTKFDERLARDGDPTKTQLHHPAYVGRKTLIT